MPDYLVVTVEFGVRQEDWPRAHFSSKKKANDEFVKESKRIKKTGGYVKIRQVDDMYKIIKEVTHEKRPA